MRVSLLIVVYSLAFLAAMATLWAFLALGLMQYFESRLDNFFITMMFALMAAMCMFSLVYSLATGVALKWQYWLFGTAFMAALVQLGPYVMTASNASAVQGFVIGTFTIYVGGLLFAMKRDGRTQGASRES